MKFIIVSHAGDTLVYLNQIGNWTPDRTQAAIRKPGDPIVMQRARGFHVECVA